MMTGPQLPANALPAVDPPRFDVVVGGLRLLLAAGMPCGYFAQAVVWPVPRAPRRLFGMMHLRGHAVPILDVQARATDLLPIVQRCPLIVLREGASAVGFICDRPPSLVDVGATLPDAALPSTRFSSALLTASRVRSDDGEGIAWSFDLVELVDLAVDDASIHDVTTEPA